MPSTKRLSPLARWLCPLLSLLVFSAARTDPYEIKEVPARLVIYVPAHGGKLERRVVRGTLPNAMPTALTTAFSVYAEEALPLLFKHAHSSFPPGTRLTAFPKVQGNVMRVSLSHEFLKRGFWQDKRKTALAVQAIVRTALQDARPGYDLIRVQLLIDGKPFRNLAHLDMRKPLSPR